jgi:class 3 adenylate cyclase
MAEPRIQYAQTKDGASIAFWTLGEGTPLVHLPWSGLGHLQLEWQYPDYRRWYERLAEDRMLVRYDAAGTGLSDRHVIDFSLEARVPDVEAVVDRLGVEKFALFGALHSGPAAVMYAVRHPERVTHLILWCSYAQGSEYLASSPQIQVVRAAADKDWDTYIELVARLSFGWSDDERALRYAAHLRELVTPELLRAIGEAIPDYDVTRLLPQVKSPTLVLHRRQVPFPQMDASRSLASQIPGAQLVVLEGGSLPPFAGDTDAVIRMIDEFLSEGQETAAKPELPEGMAVILFADIVESTALTEEFGDAAFRAKARELDTSLRSIIKESGGTPVEGKLVGDGVLAVFTSARQAIDCALRCNAASEPVGLQLHLGIHAGDVIREEGNVYGGAVNIAARIAGASAPGEVLASDTVRGLARTSAGVTFEDCGEHELKGVGEPQRLFVVRGGGG